MDKQTMINHLNEDLAGELVAIIQYITCAAKVTAQRRGTGQKKEGGPKPSLRGSIERVSYQPKLMQTMGTRMCIS